MTIEASAVARVTGITTEFINLRVESVLFLPQRIAVFAQGASASTYSTDKVEVESGAQIGALFGWGSPAHLIADALKPANGSGVGSIPVTLYPLEDGYEAVTAEGSITPSGSQTKAATYYVRAGGVLSAPFVVDPDTDSVAEICDAIVDAVNAVPKMPIIATGNATDVVVAPKWAGPSGDLVVVEVIGDALGVTYTIVQPTGGLVVPDITAALAQMGNVWETMLLNAEDIAETTLLDEFQTEGETRWGELVRKPFVCFTGNTIAAQASATAVSDARPTDRINAQLVAPGSPTLPCVVAARQLVQIARVANNNPPVDYGSRAVSGVIPGTDAEQWNYSVRDLAVKNGSSTIEVRDGLVHVADVVTFYHPTGEEPPAYRYVVDIVKLQNIIFNVDLIFATAEWDGAPLVPDNQAVTNPAARKPKSAKSEVAALMDALGLAAIISDPTGAKKTITAEIDSGNPKRLNVSGTFPLSGNANIKDFTLRWGFFFGTAAAA
jgi:phage tail sheath gpL-like